MNHSLACCCANENRGFVFSTYAMITTENELELGGKEIVGRGGAGS